MVFELRNKAIEKTTIQVELDATLDGYRLTKGWFRLVLLI